MGDRAEHTHAEAGHSEHGRAEAAPDGGPNSRTPRRARRETVFRWLARLLVVLLIMIALVIYLFFSAPRWYRPPPAGDVAAGYLAERAENRLVEEAHLIRESGENWSLRIREEQVNAWLSLRLRAWMENHLDLMWPEELGIPQIRFEPDHVLVAARVTTAWGQPVVSARLRPRVQDGQLRLTLVHTGLGRMRRPGEPREQLPALLERLQADLAEDSDAAWLLEVLLGDRAIVPAMNLADGRRVEVDRLRLRRGTLDLRAVTVAARDVDREMQEPSPSGESPGGNAAVPGRPE